jgi:hypothetical protein
MRSLNRVGAVALFSAVLVGAPGCVALQALDDVLLPNGATQLSGEVRSVDTRRGRLQVRDQHNGRTHNLQYDNRTRIVYRQRQYPASSLERGDMVRVRISHDRSGNAWAEHVEVRESVAERRSSNARVQRLDGVIRQVDTRRGIFTVEPNRARPVVV